MGRSQETFRKKENIKKKEQRRKSKEIKKENRSANSAKGKSFEDMLAYVDEHGNLTTEKPEYVKKETIKAEEILVSTPKKVEGEDLHTGKVNYYNDLKGWGFINDQHGERIFFLATEAPVGIKVDDKVVFKTQKGPKGLQAFQIELAVGS